MSNRLADIVEVLFRRVSIEQILNIKPEKKVWYDCMDKVYLQDLLLTYYHQYSDTETRMQIRELQMQSDAVNNKMCLGGTPGKLNVFSTLYFYIEDILEFHENRICCRYDKLLEWNILAKSIGEDLLVISKLVHRDYERNIQSRNFTWSPVIGHNNTQLTKILEKGMADNHFHLRVSSPFYDISWINLMNYPANKKFTEEFKRIEKSNRDKIKKSETGELRNPLHIQTVRAAAIRLYLCCKLKGVEISEVLQSIVDKYVSDSIFMEIRTDKIQSMIDSMPKDKDDIDYMLKFSPTRYFEGEEEYWILSGERWFIYKMLNAVLSGDSRFTRQDFNLFYAYIRIKNELRAELIQNNNLVGFENFQIYQSRKDAFSRVGNLEKYECLLTRLAVKDVLINPSVKSLEIRISPEKSAWGNAEYIRKCDWAVIHPYDKEDEFEYEIKQIRYGSNPDGYLEEYMENDLRRRFHYVFHFPKKSDDKIEDNEFLECRHYRYRKQILKKAIQILKFRQEYPQYGRRVVGIDACAQELGCRPEVFGSVFRTLKNHVDTYPDKVYNYMLPQLKITYHVGEEFADITDGLRAIEEAIRFLEIDCGDRLGHALALAYDVERWYQYKGNQVTMSLQDYLDNVVWLHHALIKYNIKDMSSLKGWLEEQYNYYFSYIYQSYIQELNLSELQGNGQMLRGHVAIRIYYLSWLLRGDDPELYQTGRFQQRSVGPDQWELYSVNREKIKQDDIRYLSEVTLLYYMYHYNIDVKKKGSEVKTFDIPLRYVRGLASVQAAMREEIVNRGIAIEMNPSSNISIGIFRGFEEHPIKNLYNVGLTKNEEELMNCPQISVSINTDDKGLFFTRLENEYALLAAALEKEVNEDGSRKYKKAFIYDWLDNIREMGMRQTFQSSVLRDMIKRE